MQSTQSQLVRNGGVRHDVVALNGNDYLVDGRGGVNVDMVGSVELLFLHLTHCCVAVANEARSLLDSIREVRRNRNRQQSRRCVSHVRL